MRLLVATEIVFPRTWCAMETSIVLMDLTKHDAVCILVLYLYVIRIYYYHLFTFNILFKNNTVVNLTNSVVRTNDAFSKHGVATPMMIAEIILMRKIAPLILQDLHVVIMNSSVAAETSAFQEVSIVILNVTVLTAVTKLDAVCHLNSIINTFSLIKLLSSSFCVHSETTTTNGYFRSWCNI